MRHWTIPAVGLLLAATVFYAMTAVVHDPGGSGVDLALKPWPEWRIAAGGGEAGARRPGNPGPADPWWTRDDHAVLLHGDRGSGAPIWVGAYGLGFLATAVGWIVGLCLLTLWAFRPPAIERGRRTAHSGVKRRE